MRRVEGRRPEARELLAGCYGSLLRGVLRGNEGPSRGGLSMRFAVDAAGGACYGYPGAPMLYQLHEFQRALLSPLTAWAQAASKSFANPASPLAYVPGATRLSAGYELLYRLGKDYEKPEFNLHQIVKDGHKIPLIEQTIIQKTFCRLMRFKRYSDDSDAVTQLKEEPVVLVCAPLSGHHSTLLRDTVKTLL